MARRNDERDTSRDYAEIIDIPKHRKELAKVYGYNKCLKIVLYGEPYSDSRPKPNMRTGGIALVNQQKMKKTFKEFYNRCELLQKLTIANLYHMECKFYMSITNVDKKEIKKMSKFTQKLLQQEKLAQLGEKDVDNMIKIHNDILLQDEFRITLTDAFHINQLETFKVLSEDPRAEIYLYFNDKKYSNDYYKYKVTTNFHYYLWQMSYKNWKYQSSRNRKQQLNHLRSIARTYIGEKKVNPRRVKSIMKELTYYPAEDLKELAGISKDNKMNRLDAEYKCGLLIFKNIPKAYELIKEGGKTKNDEESLFE